MSKASELLFTDLNGRSENETRWFAWNGCVEYRNDTRFVYVGGKLIGSYDKNNRYLRNLILLGLDQDKSFKKGKLAWAFDLTDEYLRRIRKRFEAEGVEAIPSRGPGGSEPKLDAKKREQIRCLFDDGASIVEAYLRVGKRGGVSYQAVWRLHKSWEAEKALRAAPVVQSDEESGQQEIAVVAAGVEKAEEVAAEPDSEPADSDNFIDDEGIAAAPVRGGKMVQHAGGLLLLALVHSYGLYEAALKGWEASGQWLDRLRMAIDAIILALGIGQRCVEGVRRLETRTAPILLRTNRAPSESWVRRIVKHYVDDVGAAKMHLRMTGVYLERARAEGQGAAVFYVDNHLRPYTGKHTLRKGWRMQDKRVRPGVTDYYVHDEDGRPVMRVDVEGHDSLTDWLSPISELLRGGLGRRQRILVAFDRAGAFPEQMAELAGKLVYHDKHYKTFCDTVRIACANAESELACELAPHLSKPAEAKKALANLFESPGDIRVNKKSITISLVPTGRKDEREAFQLLLETVSRRNLTLPGDPDRRLLCFRSQL